jgi:hypothetical protein
VHVPALHVPCRRSRTGRCRRCMIPELLTHWSKECGKIKEQASLYVEAMHDAASPGRDDRPGSSKAGPPPRCGHSRLCLRVRCKPGPASALRHRAPGNRLSSRPAAGSPMPSWRTLDTPVQPLRQGRSARQSASTRLDSVRPPANVHAPHLPLAEATIRTRSNFMGAERAIRAVNVILTHLPQPQRSGPCDPGSPSRSRNETAARIPTVAWTMEQLSERGLRES